MSRFGFISKFEGGNTMLQHIGEGEETALVAWDVSEVLSNGAVAIAICFRAEAINLLQKIMSALLVAHVVERIIIRSGSERKCTLGDVFGGVVVNRRGADVLILH